MPPACDAAPSMQNTSQSCLPRSRKFGSFVCAKPWSFADGVAGHPLRAPFDQFVSTLSALDRNCSITAACLGAVDNGVAGDRLGRRRLRLVHPRRKPARLSPCRSSPRRCRRRGPPPCNGLQPQGPEVRVRRELDDGRRPSAQPLPGVLAVRAGARVRRRERETRRPKHDTLNDVYPEPPVS
jgi:hypothetical protein